MVTAELMALYSAIDTAYWPVLLAMTIGNDSVNRHWKGIGTANTLALHSALYIAYWPCNDNRKWQCQ